MLDIGVPGTGYFVQEGPEPFGSTYERVVGGTTWHWLGSTPRLLPSDFRMKTQFGVGRDWPLTYDDLEPFYVQAGDTRSASPATATKTRGRPEARASRCQRCRSRFFDKVIAKSAATIGLTVLAPPQARNTETFNDRHHCVGNSNCIPICPIGAKYDAMIHIDRAVENGARLISNAVVRQVLLRADGTAPGVRFRRPNGSDDEVTARAVVLAANAIETPKILLMSGGPSVSRATAPVRSART